MAMAQSDLPIVGDAATARRHYTSEVRGPSDPRGEALANPEFVGNNSLIHNRYIYIYTKKLYMIIYRGKLVLIT